MPPSKRRGGGKRRGAPRREQTLEAQIVQALKREGRPLRARDLARRIGVTDSGYKALRAELKGMVASGALSRERGGRYGLPRPRDEVVGILSVTMAGDGFVGVAGAGDDVFVPASRLGSALPGDRVSVRVVGRRAGKNPEGAVTRIVEQNRTFLVGTYERVRNFGFVVPLNPKIRRDVLIPQGDEGQAKDGDLVQASITLEGSRGHGPLGAVVEVLGRADDPAVASIGIAKDRGFEVDFKPELQRAAARAGARPLGERTDRTGVNVFTIDPEDAKDHDDAVSVTAVEPGLWEVGVHIADVSHYVRQGDPVDEEARSRGTSVYLVDQVIPMLPEELSSDLCSLVPGVPRPAVSVFFTVSEDGRVGAHRFERTLIESRHRLSYEGAQAVLDGSDSVSTDADEALRALSKVARGLRAKRFERGALNFDLPEAVIELDDAGAAVSARARPRLESHRLIEDLMIATNELVARVAAEGGLPVPYRIHERPSGEGLERAVQVLAAVGFQLGQEPSPSELQEVLEAASGTPAEPLVQSMILRAMKRAEYAPENVGHYGLASPGYLHFTSPIRRYPDLLVHRAVVAALIEGGPLPPLPSGPELEELCYWASVREQEADEAERDSVAVKQVELMEGHLGETFAGTITGLAPFGAFVRLDEHFVEGLVHVSAVESDYLEFSPDRYELVGRRTGLVLSLGKPISVKVARADRRQRQIDFVPV